MKTIGVGVIGAAGYMGRVHTSIYHTLPNTKVVAVHDINLDAARQVADSVGAKCYDDYEAMLQSSDVEAVSICTSDAAHVLPCLAAAKAGKHILVEKPLAMTLADCQQIIDAAREAGIILMVGHVLRFEPRFHAIKKTIDSGEVGEVQTVATHRFQGVAAQDRLKGRCSLPLFLGVHDYDIVQWLVGSPIRKVMAVSKFGLLASQGYDIEDATFALLHFENGTIGVVELSWILPRGHYSSDSRVDVVGTKGAVTLSGMEGGLIMANEERTRALGAIHSVMYGKTQGAFTIELQHFVDCVVNERQPSISAEDAMGAVRIALAVEESARSGQPVDICSG